jgi:NAD(P)-dependent dehydrogenase (short-subunit alcohol dehydrogenase family)
MDEGGQATMTDRGVAIVTGGASGIGLAIAKALLGDGWKLVIADLAPGPPPVPSWSRCAPMPPNAWSRTSPTRPASSPVWTAARPVSNRSGARSIQPALVAISRSSIPNWRHRTSWFNAIAPGPVETPLVQALQTDKMRAEWISEVPQRRYASPGEISGAALFLLDDSKASFVTGHILNVDGGFAAGGYLPVRA